MDPLIGNSGHNRYNNYRNNRQNHYSERSYTRPNYESYVPNDLSEEEQLRRAYEESLRDSNRYNGPTAPPYPTEDTGYNSGNPPDAETLRRIRLRRYQNQNY